MASMTSPTLTAQSDRVVIGGIDTHKDIHVGALLDSAGMLLGSASIFAVVWVDAASATVTRLLSMMDVSLSGDQRTAFKGMTVDRFGFAHRPFFLGL